MKFLRFVEALNVGKGNAKECVCRDRRPRLSAFDMTDGSELTANPS